MVEPEPRRGEEDVVVGGGPETIGSPRYVPGTTTGVPRTGSVTMATSTP